MSEALSAVCDGHAPHPAEGVFGFSALLATRFNQQHLLATVHSAKHIKVRVRP